MKVYRPLVLCTLITLIAVSARAQLYKIELAQKIKASALIIEGKVIAKKSFWNDAHSMIYTSNTVEISRVFKGDATLKTVEIVTEGGSVGGRAVVASDLLQLQVNRKGIFFCRQPRRSLKSPVTGKLTWDVYSSSQGFLRYDEKNDVAYAPFARYKGIRNNLYRLIQAQTGKVPVVTDGRIDTGNSSNGESGTLAATISSFSPATVHGGALNDPANNTLTINGTGFGAIPSASCAVLFKDGNSDNQDPDLSIPYHSSYLVSWSDTKIVIKVPGLAATGKIAVVISDGSSTESATELNVFFSVLNAEFDFSSEGIDTIISTEPRLMNANASGGYTILYSTSTEGNGKNLSTAPEKATFLRALTTWKEQVGVNFAEGSTTAEQAVADDGINVVMFDNNNTGLSNHLAEGVLATTYGWFSLCYNEMPFRLFTAQKTGFDIVIRNNAVSDGNTTFTIGPCFPVDNDIDLEMVLLHELGHALNLAHINDDFETSSGNNALYINPSKLMHYAITNYVDRRSLDVAAYEGALYTTEKQGNQYGTCGLATTEMNLLSKITVDKDNCPLTFPATSTPDGTVVNFDLVHTTSNKRTDPQFTNINCGALNGQFVTNNAFYAVKTSDTATGLRITINNYATTPADEKTCNGQGIRLAVYDVNTCPAGQQYPEPVACRSFGGDVNLQLTDLQANHSYLLYFDGLRNTKAKFDVTINGDGTIPPPSGGTETGIKLYPNPVENVLFLEITDAVAGQYKVYLYDALGRTVTIQAFDIGAGSQTVSMSMVNMTAGVYFAKVVNTEGKIVSKQKICKGR